MPLKLLHLETFFRCLINWVYRRKRSKILRRPSGWKLLIPFLLPPPPRVHDMCYVWVAHMKSHPRPAHNEYRRCCAQPFSLSLTLSVSLSLSLYLSLSLSLSFSLSPNRSFPMKVVEQFFYANDMQRNGETKWMESQLKDWNKRVPLKVCCCSIRLLSIHSIVKKKFQVNFQLQLQVGSRLPLDLSWFNY